MTEESHEVKIPAVTEIEIKGNLAKGKGVTEAVIKERKSAIPSETPGKDVIIKPRSPYREFKGDHWNKGSSDRSSNESLRVNEINVRSVYNIGSSKEHESPNHQTNSFSNLAFSNPLNYQGSHSGSTPNTLMRTTPTSRGPQSMPIIQATPHNISQSHILHSGTTHHHNHFPSPSNLQYPYSQGVTPTPYASTASAQYDSYLASQFPFGNTENKIKLPPGFIPNYDAYPEHLQKEARMHFASLFSDMKIKYKDRGEDFSEYNPDLPLRYIHQIYNSYKKKFAAESCSPIVKFVLVVIFFGIDVICKKYAHTKLGVFAKSQMAKIKSYEGMINEISMAFTGDGNDDWPVGFRLGFLLFFQVALVAGITIACTWLGLGDPQYWIGLIDSYIGNSVDEIVAKKEPLEVDPLTNTTEIPKTDSVRDLMGKTQSLLAMAGQTLKPGTDVIDAVGNFAASVMEKNSKPNKPNVKFGNKK